LTINGGGKLLGNVSAEMVIITENGSIKGDVACKMLKVGFEASIIGRVFVHLTATSGSKIVMKEESLSIIENGNNDLRGTSRSTSDSAETLREGSESNVKEGLSSLKVMTPTGKDKKVKEIKDIKNMRHMDLKSEKLLDTEEKVNNLSEEKFKDPCRLTATALPVDASKLKYKEVEKLSVLKDQVEGLIESERVRGREREKEKVQSTILEYHDRSGIKLEDETVNDDKNEKGKEAVAKEENESEKEEEVVNKKEEETGNRKTEEMEKVRDDMEERRKEDMSVKEIKRTRIEKENIKSDRQRHEERDAKGIMEEKSMREVKMKADGKGDTVEREVVQVEREEQRVNAKTVITDGRDEDTSAHNVTSECVGASTQEGEGEGEGRERTVGNISNRERSDEGVNREVEQKVRLGRLGSSERTADTAEKKVKMDSFRRIETEENALREKEVEGLDLLAGEGGKEKRRQNIADMHSKTRGSEERSKEEMERSDNCADNKEAVTSKHQIGKEEVKAGSAQKRSEKTRMQDKKERKKSCTSDVMKSDSLSREDRHQSTGAGVSAGAGAGDLHSVGASPLVRKGSVDVSSRSAPAQGQGQGGEGVEAADQRVPEESHPGKGRKKEIREERRRLSKFISPAAVENFVSDKEIVAQEAMRSGRDVERELVVDREREREREGVADMRSDAGSMKANDMMNVMDEGDQQRVTVDDEDGEDDSLEDKNQQHIRSVKI
jgi:hypothetical protein